MSQQDGAVSRLLATLRVILAALAAGLVTFGLVAVLLHSQGVVTGDPTLATTFLIIVGALAISELTAYPIIRTAALTSARQRLQRGAPLSAAPRDALVGHAAPLYQTLTLVAAALAEGVALLALVGFLLSGDYRLLAFPAAAVALLIWLTPRREALERLARELGGAELR